MKNYLKPNIALILILLIGIIPGPKILGLWESLTYYFTFGSLNPEISFNIAPRANIGGQGYGLLEISRLIINVFELQLNFTTFRIPVIICGGISLVIFYKISQKYFGEISSVLATGLLASNAVFFQIQHDMTILCVSGLCFLCVIHSLQRIEIEYTSVSNWLYLAFACTITSLHYGPARIFSAFMIFYVLLKIFYIENNKIKTSKIVKINIYIYILLFIITFFILIFLLDRNNILSILKFTNFLFPPSSDIILQRNESSAISFPLASVLLFNLKIIFESIIGISGDYHSQFPTNLKFDYRYPISQIYLFPLILIGLFVCIKNLNQKNVIFSTKYLNIIVLLIVVTIPILFSSASIINGEMISSLSNFRTYFILIPMHLLIAAAISSLSKYKFNNLCYFIIILIILFQVTKIINENNRFEKNINNINFNNSVFVDDYSKNLDRRDYEHLSHVILHTQYKSLSNSIGINIHDIRNENLIEANINLIKEAPLAPPSLSPYISGRNFHSIFLALYLGELGIQADPIIVVRKDRVPINPIANMGYAGKPREYSAILEVNKKNLLDYKGDISDLLALNPVYSRKNSKFTLITTETEKALFQSVKN